jgi:hypothetical protein
MKEQFTPEAATGNPEDIEPKVLDKSELDDLELFVRELLDTGATDNDIQAVINAKLPELGITPLAEGEDRREVEFVVEGETVKKTIIMNPRDFGTFVSNVEAELLSDQETEDFPIDRLRAHHDDIHLLNELGHDAVKGSDVSIELGDNEPEQESAEADDNEVVEEEETTEHLNEETMQLARRKLSDLMELSQAEQRVVSHVMDELVDISRREMIDIDAINQDIHAAWRRMNELAEEASSSMRAIVALEGQLDTRSSLFATESDRLEETALQVRRSTQLIEEEAIYPLRVLMGLVDEAGSSLEGKHELHRRISHVAEQVQTTLSQYTRSLQNMKL